MPRIAKPLVYDPCTPPPAQWLAASESERELAVAGWLQANRGGLPCTAPGAGRWRQVEDQLAAGYPPETRRLFDRILASGVARTVAVWALAEVGGSRAFEQLNRVGRKAAPGEVFGTERLLDEDDIAILPAAFEAGRARMFTPAHEAVIEHYCRHHAEPSAMKLATAAGFCFGCAAAPTLVTGSVRSEYLFGGYQALDAPAYLPVIDAYQSLCERVSEALFEGADPIPASCKPGAEAEDGLEPPFSDWCRGLLSALRLLEPQWRRHLEKHPELRADWQERAAILTRFADPEPAGHSAPSALPHEDIPLEATIRNATRRLHLLAHPILMQTRSR
ncbi:UPF0149 family protein [Wenzhouxiangella sp. EGI_FJ10409]|uniref:UPF0149 family protein n=1 Tax=Wenzhouxiangella sp. EGI_FJ10409 TaxID=3243767 RepID=UPI0035DDAA0D